MNARTEQIIRAVYECCYLSTSDIWRIFYPQARIQASSRKVKRLTEHTYLERVYNPKKKEYLYRIGEMGIELIAALSGMEKGEIKKIVLLRDRETPLILLDHALQCADIQMQIKAALINHRLAQLKRYISWGDYALNEDGKLVKILLQNVFHPTLKRYVAVLSDGCFIIEGKDRFAGYESLFFLEIDRSTEPLGKIAQKIYKYHLLLAQKKFLAYGNFKSFKVLFITTSSKRITSIRETLSGTEGMQMLLFSTFAEITARNFFDDTIWMTPGGELKSIIKSE